MKSNLVWARAGAVLLLALVLVGCGNPGQASPAGSARTAHPPQPTRLARATAQPTAASHIGVRTKTSGCKVNGALPDGACTPGAIFATATKGQICRPGYAKSVRNVPSEVKSEVYREYGIASHKAGQYEVDHLISLELGGSNDIANLWPEAATPRPGFHEKDQVENYLHDQVCSGAVSLQEAQVQIATNWLAVYDRMPKKR